MTTVTISPERRDNGYLVAFHGLPRSGKDTIAETLKDFFHAKFAGALYEEVASTFNVRVESLMSNIWKSTPQECLSGSRSDCPKYRATLQSHGIDLKAPQTSRLHLRYWGTEYRRRNNEFYWINEIDFKIMYLRGPIVITDLRFLNEAMFLRRFAHRTNRKLRIIEVMREGTEGGHASDDRLPQEYIDLTVHNVEGDRSIAVNAVHQFLGIGLTPGEDNGTGETLAG